MKFLSRNKNSLIWLEHNAKSQSKKEIVKETITNRVFKFNGKNIKSDDYNSKEHFLWRPTTNGKIIKVSKSIIEQSRNIDFKSILNNISIDDFNFSTITVLLESDKEGYITYTRQGGDIFYCEVKNIVQPLDDIIFNSDCYSFITKEFFCDYDNDNYFAFKLLVYLFYGDITNKFIPSKTTYKIGNLTRYVNDTKHNVIFANSLWKTNISTGGFAVRGHFRLQPFGEGLSKRKLIWIEEFTKDGYNRKATRTHID